MIARYTYNSGLIRSLLNGAIFFSNLVTTYPDYKGTPLFDVEYLGNDTR